MYGFSISIVDVEVACTFLLRWAYLGIDKYGETIGTHFHIIKPPYAACRAALNCQVVFWLIVARLGRDDRRASAFPAFSTRLKIS